MKQILSNVSLANYTEPEFFSWLFFQSYFQADLYHTFMFLGDFLSIEGFKIQIASLI